MLRLAVLAIAALTLPILATALTVTVDQDVYQTGDVIQITFDNTEGEAVEFPSDPPYSIHRLDGPYEPVTGIPVIIFLAAGEVMVETWNTGDLPDPVGSYEVQVDWRNQDNPDEEFSVAVPYFLEASVAKEPTSWSRIRRLFD